MARNHCGTLQLRYARLGRQIDSAIAKSPANRKRIEGLFREYNETLLRALDHDCRWVQSAQLRGRCR
jgi:hypothetical protein